MKYQGTLIAVSDMAKAKHFYEVVMGQKILMDLGVHVSFENGLSLQSNYEELVGVRLETHAQPNNFQLYFEVEDLNYWKQSLNQQKGLRSSTKAKNIRGDNVSCGFTIMTSTLLKFPRVWKVLQSVLWNKGLVLKKLLSVRCSLWSLLKALRIY